MLSKIKFFCEQSWLLITASFAFGLLLAVTNAAWQPRIIQNELEKFNDLARVLLPEAVSFEVAAEGVEIALAKGKKATVDIKKGISVDGSCLGWAFVCQGSGFADKIRLVLAVDLEFEKLAGFGVLTSNETPGFGDKIKADYFRNQFTGAPVEGLNLSKTGDHKRIDSEIVAISGATVSSEAVVKILNTYLEQVKIKLQEKGLIDNGK
jgi:electron transport complex protein RnfG